MLTYVISSILTTLSVASCRVVQLPPEQVHHYHEVHDTIRVADTLRLIDSVIVWRQADTVIIKQRTTIDRSKDTQQRLTYVDTLVYKPRAELIDASKTNNSPPWLIIAIIAGVTALIIFLILKILT